MENQKHISDQDLDQAIKTFKKCYREHSYQLKEKSDLDTFCSLSLQLKGSSSAQYLADIDWDSAPQELSSQVNQLFQDDTSCKIALYEKLGIEHEFKVETNAQIGFSVSETTINEHKSLLNEEQYKKYKEFNHNWWNIEEDRIDGESLVELMNKCPGFNLLGVENPANADSDL
ncbi:MAG: hypothetical protein RLN62_04050 [Rickettsiales bacterium]